MRTILTTSFLLISAWGLILPSCKKEDKTSATFTITKMTPAEAFPGETVEISGAGFGATAEQNHVYFNNIEALVNSTTATSLVVVVPQGTTTGKVKVEVNGVFAESQHDFVVKQAAGDAPVITGFSPGSAPPGADIIISGHHFSTTVVENNVLIKEIPVTVSEADSTSLKVKIPTGAITGSLTVTVRGRAALSPDVFVVEDPAAPAPVLTGFSPADGIPGDPVTIQGNNFSLNPEENLVFINGVRAPVTVASSNTLRVVVPEQATTGKLTVKVNGREAMTVQDFTVIEAPVITSFSPEVAPEHSAVTIYGAHFSPVASNNTVYIHQTRATVTAASEQSLNIIVPVGAKSGKVSVTVNGITVRSDKVFDVRFVCGAPEQLGELNGSPYATKGQILNLAVKCGSPTPAGNIVTFTGGAVGTVQTVTDISSWFGEPGWYWLEVMVPAAAQSGVITLTVDGKSTETADYFSIS